jgi:hypothetical protein
MPAAELCDRPVAVEQVWGRSAVTELRDRLAAADGPQEMLTLDSWPLPADRFRTRATAHGPLT